MHMKENREIFIGLFMLLTFPLVTATTYSTEQRGQKYNEDQSFTLYFREVETGHYVSPWHDIPLHVDNQTFNMIVEIPRFSQAKFEINREYTLNPIRQDEKNGKLRYIHNLFPWHGHVCNYGAFPQTWENPFHKDPWLGQRGDKDPLDVCEVGSSPVPTGTVLPVRVLGVLALLDSGETDWKVIVINAVDAERLGIHNMEDLDRVMPGMGEAVTKFFRIYKVPSGKGENKFGYSGQIKDQNFAEDVIGFLHEEWKDMMRNCSIGCLDGCPYGYFNTINTKTDWSPCMKSQEEAIIDSVTRQMAANLTDAVHPPVIWSFVPPASPELPSSEQSLEDSSEEKESSSSRNGITQARHEINSSEEED